MWGSCRAETAKSVRRPANWFLLAIAVALGLTFGYLLPLAGSSGAGGAAPNTDRALDSILPDDLVGNSISGFPVFLGAIVLVLGVLTVGGEYGWGTWKTVFTQGPSRMAVLGGKVAALAVATLIVVLAMFLTGAVASAIIAAAEGLPMDWPSAASVLTGIGAGWLIAMTWAMFGALLAVALRGVALPIGIGLVWLLVVQNLLLGIAAPLLDWVASLQLWLPGSNAGSLVASLGGTPRTPGVARLTGAAQAALVVGCYLVLFTAAAGWLLRRRDID